MINSKPLVVLFTKNAADRFLIQNDVQVKKPSSLQFPWRVEENRRVVALIPEFSWTARFGSTMTLGLGHMKLNHEHIWRMSDQTIMHHILRLREEMNNEAVISHRYDGSTLDVKTAVFVELLGTIVSNRIFSNSGIYPSGAEVALVTSRNDLRLPYSNVLKMFEGRIVYTY